MSYELFYRFFQYLVFMADAVGVKTSAGTDALLQRDTRNEVHPDAAGRRIADAHFSDAEDAAALVAASIDQVDAYRQGLIELLFCHGWLMEKVPSATGYFAVDDYISRLRFLPLMGGDRGEVVVHTDVDDAQVKAMLAAEHVDAAPATSEINHLLPGDLAG